MPKISKELKSVYMHTSSGNKYYPFDPHELDVHMDVIAHHLATRARWAGATQHPTKRKRILFSVAEHSVIVSRHLSKVMNRPDLAMQGLMHDGAEAYNGDLIRPLKYSPAFSKPFKQVEEINEAAVADRFGLPHKLDPLVKQADNAVCYAEMQQIVPFNSAEYDPQEDEFEGITPTPLKIRMLPPHKAKQLFMARYYEIISWDLDRWQETGVLYDEY